MQFRTKLQAANDRHMPKHRDRADRPPSTAWLAAQEAFSAPRPVAAEPALVVLRKGRAAEPARPAGAKPTVAAEARRGERPVEPPAERPAEQPVERPARVFRVVTAAADVVLTSGPGTTPLAASSAAPGPTLPRRKRRVDVLKHPGPVRHIVQALPARAVMAAEPPPLSLSSGEAIARLWAEMAGLDAVFSEIHRARSFRFVR